MLFKVKCDPTHRSGDRIESVNRDNWDLPYLLVYRNHRKWLPTESGYYESLTWLSPVPIEGLKRAQYCQDDSGVLIWEPEDSRGIEYGQIWACRGSFTAITGIKEFSTAPFYYYTTFIRIGDL